LATNYGVLLEFLSKQIPTSVSRPSNSHKNDITAKLSKQEADNIIDKHFLYYETIKTYYRERNSNPNALKKAIAACRNQIALAPLTAKAFRKKWRGEPLPSHTGYKQLAIILEKQKKFQEALALCKEALKAQWDGDWENRIKHLDKKIQNKH